MHGISWGRHSNASTARFLGKLALGFGALFLGEPFISSTTAGRLRTFLWGRTAELRSDAEIHGSGFFDPIHQEGRDVMGWKPGHVFIMMPAGDSLGLNCYFYGAQGAAVEITADPAHWREHIPNEGAIYVVSPSRQKFSGPHTLSEFVAAKLGGAKSNGARALAEFMEQCSRQTTLPRYHLDGTGGIMLIAERFEAFIYEDGEKRVLGVFDSQEAAERVYDEAALNCAAPHGSS